MYYLVVRQGQYEFFGIGVEHAEGQVVLVVAAVDRIALHVAQHIVHPAHVPLEAKAEAAGVGRAGNIRPSSRFLGDHQGARAVLADGRIELSEEVDGFEVFAPAIGVGHPFPF